MIEINVVYDLLKQVTKEIALRLIELLPSTEIFSKRRKIYAF